MVARRMVGAWVLVLGLTGCSVSAVDTEASELGQRLSELSAPNGRNLNGRNLNGRNLNGGELGQMLVSVRFAGARRSAAESSALTRTWLEGSVLQGETPDGRVSGTDFVGARFTGNLGSGDTVELRVDDVQPGTDASAGVWVYRVSYFSPEDDQWKPACPAEDGSGLGAIPVAGAWDYRQGVPGGGGRIRDASVFTFACEGAAIAKCIRFGYQPWARTPLGLPMEDLHQACTRMVRADFCGDGTSYTQDGNWVNLYDVAGVQEDTETWSVEAEWDADGARCFAPETRAGSTPVACGSRLPLLGCGLRTNFLLGTLLMSEVPPEPPGAP
ncbi:hypothetical protein LZ198_05265 [Myxococcus sp. K15C18031901]|uniref:ADYC domain-containing protein n=1 Tax=Myxococcus dinghuensis TaxID=2906761 RepID=UPI0020A808F3|nr:ADYC domain-containing protein [Myxococcus dinghuensis]MCP3098286.1 hypothetical protein [Myxococcus dinghuensis]